MNAPTSSSLRSPSDSRVTPSSAREIGERVGERGPDLLAPVAVAASDDEPRLGRRARQAAERAAASRRPPSGGRRTTSSSGCSRLSRRRSSVTALWRRYGRSRRHRSGRWRVQRAELGHEPRQLVASAAETLLERLGVADAQHELEPLPQRLVRNADRRARAPVEDEHAVGAASCASSRTSRVLPPPAWPASSTSPPRRPRPA